MKMPITKILKNTQKHNRFETSTYSQREEEIERGCEEERKGSPVPIFPPLGLRILRMLTD